MDALMNFGQGVFGGAWPAVWTLVKIVAIVAPLMTAREIVQPLPGNYRAKPIRKVRPVQVASREPIVEQQAVVRKPVARKPEPAFADGDWQEF